LEESHEGIEIFNKFKNTLEHFEIEEKLLAITIDNASNGETFTAALTNWAEDNDFSFNENYRIRCFAHILNLAVKSAYEGIAPLIHTLREKIQSITKSTTKSAKFSKILEKKELKLNLIMDVCTRWNSTYDMLKRAHTLREV
jgi:hypothetical protein